MRAILLICQGISQGLPDISAIVDHQKHAPRGICRRRAAFGSIKPRNEEYHLGWQRISRCRSGKEQKRSAKDSNSRASAPRMSPGNHDALPFKRVFALEKGQLAPTGRAKTHGCTFLTRRSLKLSRDS
jgi:hypothetical protein